MNFANYLLLLEKIKKKFPFVVIKDLDEFYNDIETPGGSLYIPDREVETVERRRNSRNTHYMLTAEEAEEIKNGSLAVLF